MAEYRVKLQFYSHIASKWEDPPSKSFVQTIHAKTEKEALIAGIEKFKVVLGTDIFEFMPGRLRTMLDG